MDTSSTGAAVEAVAESEKGDAAHATTDAEQRTIRRRLRERRAEQKGGGRSGGGPKSATEEEGRDGGRL